MAGLSWFRLVTNNECVYFFNRHRMNPFLSNGHLALAKIRLEPNILSM